MTAEQEIDGQTLAGLTELMISHLLPTMKLQVKFMSMLNVLKTTSSAKQVQVTSVLSPYVSAANSDEWRVERVPSSPSLQNGFALKLLLLILVLVSTVLLSHEFFYFLHST